MAVLTAALLCAPPLSAWPAETLSLESLEAQISDAPGIHSKESSVDAKLQALRGTQDKAGLGIYYEPRIGNEAIIVARSTDDHVLRFQQSLGISVPLFGTRIEQQLAIVGAAEQVQIARIGLNEVHRERIAALRKAYLQYWAYGDQAKVANAYVTGSESDLTTGRSLRKTGFFTSTDLLDIQQSVQKIQFEIDSFNSLQRSQLATVGSTLGYQLPAFLPVAPDFFDGCVPDRTAALNSAYEVDPTLAQIAAETVQVQQELGKVKGSSISSNAYGEAGSATDINHRVSGYRIDAGLALSMSVHGRDEERALRAQYTAELQALAFSEKQRRVEIEAALDAALDNVQSAQTILQQAQADERARDQDLRTAKAAFDFVRQDPRGQFIDVHTKRTDLLTARTAVSVDRESVLLQATDLLLIAPAACGSSFQPIPPFVLPAKARKRTKAPNPRWTPTPKPTAAPVPTPTAVTRPITSPSAMPTTGPTPTPEPQPSATSTPETSAPPPAATTTPHS